MLIRQKPRIKPSEITAESRYLNRRGFYPLARHWPVPACCSQPAAPVRMTVQCHKPRPSRRTAPNSSPNSFEDVTSYNNFYEFGLDKKDPARYAGKFKSTPWSVTVDGEAEITGTFDFEDIVGPHTIEERLYRFRCVEAWSMVVPWNGIPLADLLKRFKPTSKAKYVAFETVYRPSEMPGQRARVLDFPYIEGLTIAEAMHPLTLMATGLYGVDLPNHRMARHCA